MEEDRTRGLLKTIRRIIEHNGPGLAPGNVEGYVGLRGCAPARVDALNFKM